MHTPFHITPVKGLSPSKGRSIKDGGLSGGKWEIVTEFNGNSHRNGGIDLEVSEGVVRRIHAPHDKPDEIAKNGRVWRDIGAGAYGAGEGLLDTLTLGATDQLTDLGYEALQKAGGSTEDEIREQNSIRGYATAAGAITGGILSGGAATGAAVQQGTKGIGAGVSQGSPDSKFAQGVGTYLPLAGSIAGTAMGNAGYAEGSKLGSFAQSAGKIQKFNPMIQGASSALQSVGQPQQPLNLGPTQEAIRAITPYTSPAMIQGYKQLGEQLKGEASPKRSTGMTAMDGVNNYVGAAGPIQFQQQPIYAADANNYLRNYGINA